MLIGDSEIVYAELVRREPGIGPTHGRQLAALWTCQLSRIVSRVLEIGKDDGRAAWHIDARTEAGFAMANLLLFLTERIVTHRLKDRAAADIDLASEEAALTGPEAAVLIENTAQNIARGLWNRIYDKLHEKYPLVAGIDQESLPRLSGRSPRNPPARTHRNHFVPEFTVKAWRNDSGELQELRRRRDGSIEWRRASRRRWGYARFLYPQWLEDYFQQLETRAVEPYTKILQCLPLTPDDRYFWIAFLIVQHLRTPAFMATIASGLRRQIVSKGWRYPTTPEAMRRAYLTLFDQDDLFAAYYRRFDGQKWRLLASAAPLSFPRTDVPIVLTGAATAGGWRALYPLSPERCLQLGPEPTAPSDFPFALTEALTAESTVALNRLLLQHASRSAVVRTGDDPILWSGALDSAFSAGCDDDYRAWGPLMGEV